jgi:hypothetical protein
VRLHDRADFHPALVNHCAPPLLFRRQPPQLNCPANNVPVAVEKLRGCGCFSSSLKEFKEFNDFKERFLELFDFFDFLPGKRTATDT